MLAAGSFDNHAHVFDLKEKSGRILSHHTDRVRSVHWNSEIPWLLVTGGDDSK